MTDVGAQPVDRVVRLTYAVIVDGLDKEQRAKIDAALDGLDAATGADRRKVMRDAGFTEDRIEQIMRVSAAPTPEARAEMKAKLAMAAAERRRAQAAAGG